MSLPLEIVLVVGPPAAGKGTLCRKHPIEHGYYHFSIGDYLRELCTKPNEYPDNAKAGFTGQKLTTIMSDAKLLPAEAMVQIIRYKLEQQCNKGYHKFFIDGFPRTLDSAKLFDEEIGKPSQVIVVHCSKSAAKARFLKRSREGSDNDAKFEARYKQYQEESVAIRNWYNELLKEIDNDDEIDKAHDRVLSLCNELAQGATKE